MKKSRAPQGAVQAAAAGVGGSRAFLDCIIRILVGNGHSPSTLIQEFTEICASQPQPRIRFDPEALQFVANLPHVLAHWYGDPSYLTENGAQPLPLPFRGPEPSLVALIRRVYPGTNPEKVKRALLRNGAIRQSGALFEPVAREVHFADPDTVRAHSLIALLGHLLSIANNLGDKPRVVERAAINSRIPVSRREELQQEASERARAFLEDFDALLRRWEAPLESTEPLMQVILGAYLCDSTLGFPWISPVASSDSGTPPRPARLREKP